MIKTHKQLVNGEHYQLAGTDGRPYKRVLKYKDGENSLSIQYYKFSLEICLTKTLIGENYLYIPISGYSFRRMFRAVLSRLDS